MAEPQTSTPTQHHDPRVARVESLISTILRTGVIASLSIVVFGTVLSFVHHTEYVSSPQAMERLTRPGAAFPRTLGEVIDGIGQLRGQAIMVAGLILLIATPVTRVAVSIFAFVYQRDRMFVLITTAVLLLLLVSFLLGKVEG